VLSVPVSKRELQRDLEGGREGLGPSAALLLVVLFLVFLWVIIA
jgi:hypothetical protein